jgi:hypothetical protein
VSNWVIRTLLRAAHGNAREAVHEYTLAKILNEEWHLLLTTGSQFGVDEK